MNQIKISYEISLRTAPELQWITRELKNQELTATNVITFTLDSNSEQDTEDQAQQIQTMLENGYDLEVIGTKTIELN